MVSTRNKSVPLIVGWLIVGFSISTVCASGEVTGNFSSSGVFVLMIISSYSASLPVNFWTTTNFLRQLLSRARYSFTSTRRQIFKLQRALGEVLRCGVFVFRGAGIQ